MNDFSKKSVKNLLIFILLGLLILSFVIVCRSISSGERVGFVWTIMPIASIIYGAVSFIRKYLIVK